MAGFIPATVIPSYRAECAIRMALSPVAKKGRAHDPLDHHHWWNWRDRGEKQRRVTMSMWLWILGCGAGAAVIGAGMFIWRKRDSLTISLSED